MALRNRLVLVCICGELSGCSDPSYSENQVPDSGAQSSGENDSSDSQVDNEGPSDTDLDDDCCSETNPDGQPDGASCLSNDDCMSALCLGYSQAPFDPAALCEPAPFDFNTRFAGRVLRWGHQATLSGAELRVAGAIAASQDPVGAVGLATATADGEGRFDCISDSWVEEPIAVMGLVEAPDYHLSISRLAVPRSSDSNEYGPGNDWRDLYVVAEQDLTTVNQLAGEDPSASLAEYLPLGPKGGVLGIVRDAETGEPRAQAQVVPVSASSSAIVRYVDLETGAWSDQSTFASGLFVVLNSELAEEFYATEAGDSPQWWTDSTWVQSTEQAVNMIAFDIID